MEVGIRELKAKLSYYLGEAAAGVTIVVTDRGRPVATIAGLTPSNIERGIDEGWIEPARRSKLGPPTHFRASRSVLDVLDEDRG